MLAHRYRLAQPQFVAARYGSSDRRCQTALMTTVAEIRRANLNLLLQEVGEGRGDAARLARLTGVNAPTISQLRRITRYRNGTERTMGDDIARKLEKGMSKPHGWMDHPHDITKNADEAEFLRTFRALTQEQREHLAATAELLAKSNRTGPKDGEPLPPTKRSH